jgi:ABC-2 type transport system ATP-binding protein
MCRGPAAAGRDRVRAADMRAGIAPPGWKCHAEAGRMIRAERLTKCFGDFTAIRDVSFEAAEGEVVGFLGVNGAGKTTTLRVLTGFYPPTSGRAIVAGFDVGADSIGARRNIGYMPETTPLYNEMRVVEYLRFRSAIKGVERRRRAQETDRVIERAGLREVSRQVIGTLSKGYRQRVGLADALLGSPRVLILDEPTSGLDPLQRMQLRQVLREEGRGRTVLLSTHILPEAEAACDRILIIHRGRLIPDEEIAALRAGDRVRVTVRAADRASVLGLLKVLPGIGRIEEAPAAKVRRRGGAADEVSFDASPERKGADLREAIFRAFAERSVPLLEIRRMERSLEEIFGIITLGAYDERGGDADIAAGRSPGGSGS